MISMNNSDGTAVHLIESATGILVDWDGCIAFGDVPTQWGLSFLARYRETIAILSNNSTHLPDDFSAILRAHGLTIPPQRIVLAGVEALKRTAEKNYSAVQVLACPRMQHFAQDMLHIPLVEQGGDCVVLLRDTAFSYRRLELAANALRGGASLIVSNPDLTHPGPGGSALPETGALFAALKSCADLTHVAVEIVGKPNPELFYKACAALGTAPEAAIMIGDNPHTDIDGARRAGLNAVLIDGSLNFVMPSPPPEMADIPIRIA